MIDHLAENKIGEKKVTYKLRDWLFSRQRYWGEPFPVFHKDGKINLVEDVDLPVELPEVANYEPSEDGSPPLANATEWMDYNGGLRETDTMPGSAGSSWYFLRFCDPSNSNSLADINVQKYWMPVDFYLGGPEHTVGHLLYARFWQKVLFDEGLATCDEPFQKLGHQGMILGTDGEKMSKSRGNVVNPDDIVGDQGADALRLYEMFMGPLEAVKPWQTSQVAGVVRFMAKAYNVISAASGVNARAC